jgi:fumarylacetoacetate (FAA) hydrolase
MKLATIRDGTRDGHLVIVNRKGDRATSAAEVARSLQAALDDWDRARPKLEEMARALEAGLGPSEPLDPARVEAPLPRAYEWIDGSAYLSHIVLVRKARGAEPPKTLRTDPLVYQGGSGVLLGAHAPLELVDPSFGLDFEAEVAVILGDTPRGVTRDRAEKYVRLLVLANDVTYRNLVPAELEKGFGFFCSKPATAFSPFAITPDELGAAWRDGRVHLRLRTYLNGTLVGDPDAGEPMHFSFFDLIEHVTRTRALTAGTILGSGTVSNEDPARGVSCLAERRMREVIEHGSATTPFLRPGDRVRMEMLLPDGQNPFGSIDQEVVST